MATVDKRTNNQPKKTPRGKLLFSNSGNRGQPRGQNQDQEVEPDQYHNQKEDSENQNNTEWSHSNHNKPSYDRNRNENSGYYPKKSYANTSQGQEHGYEQGHYQGQNYNRGSDRDSYNTSNYHSRGGNHNNYPRRNNNYQKNDTRLSNNNHKNRNYSDSPFGQRSKETHNNINQMTSIKEIDDENIEDVELGSNRENQKETNNVNVDEVDEVNEVNEVNEVVDEVNEVNEADGVNETEIEELPEFVDDFEKMNLSHDLLKGVFGYGFKYPSPIQSRTIHIINNGHDLIAQSQSGSGKTGAFAIGSLSNIDISKRYPQVLILANTRILADQIMKVTQNISMYMNIEISLCVGGGGGPGQKNNGHSNTQQLKTSHVLVGTPGRICDMLSNNVFDGKRIRTLIMDESDALLKDDFRPQIIEIISKMGTKTQICIFSATYAKETLQITENFLRNPYRITIEKEDLSVKNVKQFRIDVQYETYKLATLRDIFTKLTISQMIIFVNSIRSAEELRNKLMDNDVQAGMIHGKMSSIDRENVLKEFRLSYIKILISTDVMCRGIDIDDLRIVINYDMADYPDTYIHRVGRSGRYGGQGIAINFCTYDDYHKIRTLERDYGILIRSMPNPNEVNEYLTGMTPPDGKVLSSKNYN